MAQQQQERNASVPGDRDDEEFEEESATGEANNGRGENAAVVGVVGEVPVPPEEGNATGEVEGEGEDEGDARARVRARARARVGRAKSSEPQ